MHFEKTQLVLDKHQYLRIQSKTDQKITKGKGHQQSICDIYNALHIIKYYYYPLTLRNPQ